jgi:hypothetical protein
MVVPIAQEHSGFATLFLGLGNKPINELITIGVVYQAITF